MQYFVRSLLLLLWLLILAVPPSAGYWATPCCEVVSVQPDSHEPTNGIVTARDIKTGRTYQFKVGAAALRGLKTGSPVEIDPARGRVLSVAGVPRTYAVFEPDAGDPINEIVSIQPDSHEPTNGIVQIRNRSTGAIMSFSANNSLLSSLRVGSSVALDSSGSYAMVRSSAMGGTRATYSFPVMASSTGVEPSEPVNEAKLGSAATSEKKSGGTAQVSKPDSSQVKVSETNTTAVTTRGRPESGRGEPINEATGAIERTTPANEGQATTTGGDEADPVNEASAASAATSDEQRWEMTTIPNFQGRTGRLLVNVPTQASMIFHLFRSGEPQHFDAWYTTKTGAFMPGEYDIAIFKTRINGVPIEKGKNTRIKVGVLDLTSVTGKCSIDASDGTTVLTGCAAKKLALPIGSYTVKFSGGEEPVTIKDGEVTTL